MIKRQCRSSIRPKLARQSLGMQAEKATSLQYGDDAPPSHRRTNAVSAASRNFGGGIVGSGHEDRSDCRSPAKRRVVGRLHQRSTLGNLTWSISNCSERAVEDDTRNTRRFWILSRSREAAYLSHPSAYPKQYSLAKGTYLGNRVAT